jgi:hypothetical protein
LWSSSIRRIFTNSSTQPHGLPAICQGVFTHSLCSLLLVQLKDWTNVRSRACASSGVAVQRPCLGAGFHREWQSPILFLVDLDLIRSRICHQGNITTAPKALWTDREEGRVGTHTPARARRPTRKLNSTCRVPSE